jgi:predicted enzyme related to lactoylglutathione lyase
MGTQLKHPAGNFCWFELATSDQNGAKAFYNQLFGWEAMDNPLPPEMGGVYTTFTLGGKEVGACFTLGPQMEGVPPNWMPYVAVDDADAIAAKVAALGGEVLMPAFDVMAFGRMTAFKDPTGAALSVWQPKDHLGADLVNATGSACWGELATRDTAKAKAFYTELFGWTTKDSEVPGMTYTEWSNGPQPIGGMLPMDGPQWDGVPPHWLTYFTVEDADATAEAASAAGGKVIMPPMDIPNTGRFAVLADPQGAVFAVIKLTMPMS